LGTFKKVKEYQILACKNHASVKTISYYELFQVLTEIGGSMEAKIMKSVG
jgi:hypothetical protein